ncbi:NAD(P)/FAD-dependent oxidoreductase [Ktedonosporobacter rubrisoli]|uniref:NAD(P)/FAD-dependent oxidoreductase n=1 Tax=Ktedonosporobacter rubrisoli TaxID=2509675 RepID=UPI001F5D0DCB|nr:NAD(P)/FAD-dependent oxidoreductase [Ktedonosporobacter rubrisoli]
MKIAQDQAVQVPQKGRDKTTTPPHVVIVGGGFGGLQAAKALRRVPVRVTLIDYNNFHLFQPMLYQVATGGLAPSDITAPLRAVLRKQRNTEVLMAEVTGIDTREQLVYMDKQTLHYDYLILATGSSNNYFGHPQWEHLAPGMKSADDALTIRRMVFSAFEEAEREADPTQKCALLTFVLVGGGPTGVELAGNIAELAHHALEGDFRCIDPGMARIVLVQGPKHILPGFPPSLVHRATKELQRMGVEVRTGTHVKDVTESGVMIGDEHFPAKNVIWTAGVKASPASKWLQAEADNHSRVKVLPDLTVPGCANVFVIGDTASLEQNGKPLPGLAPVAMQEGEYAASVIADAIEGKKIQKPFHYFDKGTMATVGHSYGIVDVGPFHFDGMFAWLLWLLVHIMFLIGFRNRIIVMLQYAWTYITYQRGAQIILPSDAIHNPRK